MSEAVSVRSEIAPGPYFVGQGFEVRIGVVAGGQRPKIDPPRIAGARTWVIGTEVRPITASSIGAVLAHENVFVVRFRIVPERPGSLEIPSIPVTITGRSGRSRAKTVTIQTVPLAGRPADFLGGVGRFELAALASPKVIRVGQDLEFRIKVTGPAAWGMTNHPDMERYDRIGLGLRLDAKPDEITDEPPARSFVYRIRPTHPGEAILPPITIASFDPSLSRYVTQKTAGIPIRVIAVPAFDPATVLYDPPSNAVSLPVIISLVVSLVSIVAIATYLVFRQARRRRSRPIAFSPELARRFARKTALYLRSLTVVGTDIRARPIGKSMRRYGLRMSESRFQSPDIDRISTLPVLVCNRTELKERRLWNLESDMWKSENGKSEILPHVAQDLYHYLNEYIWLGTGQSLAVMTPDETREGISSLSCSDEDIARAGELAARCDRILYGEPTEDAGGALRDLLEAARRLFEALGEVNNSSRRVG